MKKIIVAGQVCADITPVFGGRFNCSSPAEIFCPGQLVMVDSTVSGGGGCVCNTGLALKKLGINVGVVGKIGCDSFGDYLTGLFSLYGVNGLVCDEKCSTSYSVAIAVPGSDRIFIHDPGANSTFRASDVSDEAIADADYFHFGYPCLMRSMYLNDGEELISLFRRVKSRGITTSLDFSTISPNSEAGTVRWEKILKDVLPFVDFFVPSFEELCFMIDRPKYNILSSHDGDMTNQIDVGKDARELAVKSMELGAKHVLVKCGGAGLFYMDSSCEIIQPCFVPEEVKSGAGAGDACIAAFLASIMHGKPIHDCVMYAAAEGACCVEKYDSLSGVKTLEEIDGRIAFGWETAQ